MKPTPTIAEINSAMSRINKVVEEKIVDPSKRRSPILDGVVDPETYVNSDRRILWFLREPYDERDNGKASGGEWSLVDWIKEDLVRASRIKTYQTIGYITHGVLDHIHDWDEMDWISESEKIRSRLLSIALINTSKLPGLTSSNYGEIAQAFEQNGPILHDQIEAFRPDVIFACAPAVHRLKEDLADPGTEWSEFGMASAVMLRDRTKLVWVYHPSARKNRRSYVNDAIRATVNPLE